MLFAIGSRMKKNKNNHFIVLMTGPIIQLIGPVLALSQYHLLRVTLCRQNRTRQHTLLNLNKNEVL